MNAIELQCAEELTERAIEIALRIARVVWECDFAEGAVLSMAHGTVVVIVSERLASDGHCYIADERGHTEFLVRWKDRIREHLQRFPSAWLLLPEGELEAILVREIEIPLKVRAAADDENVMRTNLARLRSRIAELTAPKGAEVPKP